MKNQNKLRVRKIKSVSSPIMKGLLKLSLAAGFVGTVVVAPNSLQAIDMVVRQIDKHNARRKRFSEYARQSKYFDIEKVADDRYCIRLSEKGVKAAQDVLFQEYELPTQQKWDGTWHILMFDIAEEHKYLRDVLSSRIDSLGMKMIQNSVYVYPYDLGVFTNNLHSAYPEVMQHVLHVQAVKIDGEEQLVETFRKAKVL